MKSSLNIALLSGEETIDFKVLYCLYRSFKNIHVISNNECSILKYSLYKKNFKYIPWSANSENQKKNVEEIKQYCDSNKIEFIMVGDCDSVVFLDKYKNNFSNQKYFPTMSIDSIEKIDNKWKFADTLMRENISIPHTFYIDTLEKIEGLNINLIEKEIGFPLIVKPILGDDSLGVYKINSFEKLREYILGENSYNALPLIIQKYIDGYDIDLSFIAKKGKILSMAVQRWSEGDVLEFCQNEEIEECGKRIVSLFNYSGPGHFDMRIESKTGKVYVIECNPRFWRSVTAAMWCGLNFTEVMVKDIIGGKYEINIPTGHYTLTGHKIKSIVKKPWTYFSFSKTDREEIWYNLSDFLPHIVTYWRYFRG